ncbi:hypothetical protein E8L99_03930 [Phreatobacter aquaticus]|uniref:Uncharacterized protein n=1 Tax=Phreatobacter aquaticus TaxID=2570229 RepID=A0A4D7QHN9_9HYPH|nr:hypothetical protein [Phreatobacter aquaticus]QCK84984.1 hypothetical protein E8L99_03930 [Phreatobacter aquaticus]
MTNRPPEHPDDRARREEAERILARTHRDSAPIAGSAVSRSVDFLTAKGEGDDPAEIWGKRVGRGLAVIIGIGCLIFLYLTYVAR